MEAAARNGAAGQMQLNTGGIMEHAAADARGRKNLGQSGSRGGGHGQPGGG